MFLYFRLFIIVFSGSFVPFIWANNLFSEPRNPPELNNNYQKSQPHQTFKKPSFEEKDLVLRKRVVQINKHLLMEESQSPITLNLFKDAFVNLTSKNILNFKKDSPFISGSLEDGGHMQVSTFKDGSMIGEVHSKRGVYSISSLGGGNHIIEEVDTSKFDFKCGAGEHKDHLNSFNNFDFKNFNFPKKDNFNQRFEMQAIPQTSHQMSSEEKYIDLLVIYTQDTREMIQEEMRLGSDEVRGRAEIEKRILHEINKTNNALIYNGGNGFDNFFYNMAEGSYKKRIRLVGIKEIINADSSFGLGVYLNNLIEPTTDLGGFANNLRELYRADFVHLLVPNPISEVLGIAGTFNRFRSGDISSFCSSDPRVPLGILTQGECFRFYIREEWKRRTSSGVSCFNQRCRLQHVVPHEIGHNMGLFHDRYTHNSSERPLSPRNSPFSSYGFGYVNQNTLTQNREYCWHTIMAYEAQCLDSQDEGGFGFSRDKVIGVPYFSDPNISSTKGDPAGVPGDTEEITNDGPVDAKRAIKEVYDHFLTKLLPGDSCYPYLFGTLFEDFKKKIRSDSITRPDDQILFNNQGAIIKVDGGAHSININLRDVPSGDYGDCAPNIQPSLEDHFISADPFTPSQNVLNPLNTDYVATISVDQNSGESSRSSAILIFYPKYKGSLPGTNDPSITIIIEQDPFSEEGSSSQTTPTTTPSTQPATTPPAGGSQGGGGDSQTPDSGSSSFNPFTNPGPPTTPNNQGGNGDPQTPPTTPENPDGNDNSNPNPPPTNPPNPPVTNPPVNPPTPPTNPPTTPPDQDGSGDDSNTPPNTDGDDNSNPNPPTTSVIHQDTSRDLSGQGLTGIPNDLSSYPNLKTLNLSENNISKIPQDAFLSLTQLDELDLSYNIIKNLYPFSFRGLNNLKSLFINNNQISLFPERVFEDLNQLTSLDLKNNQIESIETLVFSQSLKDLDLGFNKIREGISNINLRNLEYLWLNENNLGSEIENLARFQDSSSLTSLNLDNNNISVLSGPAFSGLSSLRYLWLSNNNIRSISQNAFEGLDNLVYLNLSVHQLNYLPQSVCEFLRGVRILILDNSLESLCSSSGNVQKQFRIGNIIENLASFFAPQKRGYIVNKGVSLEILKEEKNLEVIRKMVEDGVSLLDISSVTGLSERQIFQMIAPPSFIQDSQK